MPMEGSTVVITGGNAGIGKETAVGLAGLGARVIITSRDQQRGAGAVEEIRRRSGSEAVDVLPLDLASFASIRAFAADLLERTERIDVLVNNAGLILRRRTLTADGFEATFGVNHLGHFLLTDLLLDRLRSSAPARVVVVASDAHESAKRGLDFDDLQSERGYRWGRVYAKSKLANIYFARELARRLEGSGVTSNSLHPGFVRSEFGQGGDLGRLYGFGLRYLAAPFTISQERGATTSIHVASAPELAGATGGYYLKCAPATPSAVARDDDAARRLWDASERLVAGVSGRGP
jgi:NAD(P)-dependent dehydrogenase (short-subunit alcohol dehydrogenase family)